MKTDVEEDMAHAAHEGEALEIEPFLDFPIFEKHSVRVLGRRFLIKSYFRQHHKVWEINPHEADRRLRHVQSCDSVSVVGNVWSMLKGSISFKLN